MKTLIPLSDFVLEQQWNKNGSPKCDISERSQSWQLIVNYTEFLKQPLKLEIFIPCDEKGNVLKEPERRCNLIGFDEQHFDFDDEELRVYCEAKENVLFKGFELLSSNTVFNSDLGLTIYLDIYQFSVEDSLGIGGGDIWGKTLEALAYTNLNLTLTPSALKQIGVNE